MNRAQLATLANEIEQSAPVSEWDLTELKKFKHTITLANGDKKPMKFDDLVLLYKTLDAEVKSREGRMKDIKEAISAAMDVAGEEHVVCEGFPVDVIVKSGSKKLSPEKLLAKGVPAMTIAECYDISPDSRYVQVGRQKKDR